MSLTNGLKLIVQTRVQDKLCSFGLAFKADTAINNNSTQDLAEAWYAATGSALLGILAEDVTFEALYCHALQPGVALPHREPGASQPGTRSGSSGPANSCMVITLQTIDAGAVRQGRIYISGVSKTDLTEGVWDATFLSGNVDGFQSLLDNVVAGSGVNYSPQIVQRVIGGVTIPGNLLAVSNTRVTNIPYTQRRRTTKQLGFGAIP